MARVHDIETFCDDLKTLLQAKLSAKLTAITTEKGDGLTLPAIPNGAYFWQTLDQRVTNYSEGFLFYGIQDVQPVSTGSATHEKYEVEISILIPDPAMNEDQIVRRAFRYWRALRELFEENSGAFKYAAQIKIQSIPPTLIQLFGTSTPFRAASVVLQVNLA